MNRKESLDQADASRVGSTILVQQKLLEKYIACCILMEANINGS